MQSTKFYRLEVLRYPVALKCTKSAEKFTNCCVERTTASRGSLVRAPRAAAVVQSHRADGGGLGAEPYRLWQVPERGITQLRHSTQYALTRMLHASCSAILGRYKIAQMATPASVRASAAFICFRTCSESPGLLSEATVIEIYEL